LTAGHIAFEDYAWVWRQAV